MATVKISKRTVDASIKEGLSLFLWDAELKGFGLKVLASGKGDATVSARASYIVQYRVKGRAAQTKRYTIGRHGSPWTPEMARSRAADLLEMVRLGIDPAEKERAEADEAKRTAVTASALGFSAYADTYLKRRVACQKRSKEVQSIFTRDLKPHFGDKLLTAIRRSDVNELLDMVGERNGSAANKAHKALKTFFAWAVARDTITTSPMTGVELPAPLVGKPREHVLAEGDLRMVWAASASLNAPFGPLVRMLIVTGQRLREVAGMTWAEIDADKRVWTIPGTRTKNGQTHKVPLTPLSWEVLEGIERVKSEKQFVFTTTGATAVSGFSKTKVYLDRFIAELAAKEAAETGEPIALPHPWRFHDLRRTLATGCERIGVPLPVTEAILNHVSGSKRGIIGVYQLHNYADEKRTALVRWADEITRMSGACQTSTGAVIDMTAARAARVAAG